MSILRTLVIVANIGVAIWLMWLLMVDFPDGSDSLILAGLSLLFILNTYFFLFLKKNNDWFSLFFQRKTLEEKKKIKELEK